MKSDLALQQLSALIKERSVTICSKEEIDSIYSKDRWPKPGRLPKETNDGDAEFYHSDKGVDGFRILYKSGDGSIKQFVVTEKEIESGAFDGVKTSDDFIYLLLDAQFRLTLNDVARNEHGPLDQTIQAVTDYKRERELAEASAARQREEKLKKEEEARILKERTEGGFRF